MRKQALFNNERFLFWCQHGEHVSCTNEGTQLKDYFGYCHEHVEKIFRVDVRTWQFEDVTEDFAYAWVDENCDHNHAKNVNGFGPWLEESMAMISHNEGAAH